MTDTVPPPPALPSRPSGFAATLRRATTVVPVVLGLLLFALAVALSLPGLWTLRRTGLGIEGAGVVELQPAPGGPEGASLPLPPARPAPPLPEPPGTAVRPAAAAPGTAARIWTETCATCHGPAGVPTPLGRQVGASDLTSAAVRARSDAELRAVILDGRGRMLPYRGRLSEAQVDDLVRHLRTFGGGGAD